MTKIETASADRWCARMAGPYRSATSGVVAALATLDDEIIRSYGDIDPARPSAPDADNLFEIGSITKVFTAILLAKLSLDGRIDLDAPIGDLLPEFEGVSTAITPRRLSTHTSGLPRLPIGVLDRRYWCFHFPESRFNPYPDFTTAELVAWMHESRKPREVRAGRFHYSNLGVALLGYILGRLAGCGYEAALHREILDPLGLDDTRIALDDDQAARFALPRRRNGAPAPLWRFEGLAGAGALRSTTRDLLRFGRAVILAERAEGPLAAPIRKTLEPQIVGRRHFEPGICLGWSTLPKMISAKTIYNHDGGTFGSMSSLFVCPEAGFVLTILANRGLDLMTPVRQIRSDPAGVMREMVAAFDEPNRVPAP